MKNYYKTLGLTRNCTQAEIKSAYKELAKKWHPDKNKLVNAHDMFIEIHEAYEILSNPIKRASYDELFSENNSVVLVNKEFKQKQHDDFVKEAKQKAHSVSRMNIDSFLENLFMSFDYLKAIFWGVMGISLIGAATYIVIDEPTGDSIFTSIFAGLFGIGMLKIANDYIKKINRL